VRVKCVYWFHLILVKEKLLEMVPLPDLIDHVDLSADLKLVGDCICVYADCRPHRGPGL
jgi:hypothetical protein